MYIWVFLLGVLFLLVNSGHCDRIVQDEIVNDASSIRLMVDSILPVDTLASSNEVDVGVTQSERTSDHREVTPVDPVQAIRVEEPQDGLIANATAEHGSSVLSDDQEAVDGGTDASGNVSATDAAAATKRSRPTKVECLRQNETDMPDRKELAVQILNHTSHSELFKTVPNATVAPCSLILFYAPFCPFSASAAPHFNAMARLYPDVPCVAVDASMHVSLNARYGTVALPTLYLFHNGHPVAKFNESTYTLDGFVAFVRKYASLEPDGLVNVTSADFIGPLPAEPVYETDWLLWLAWTFVLACSGYGITKSSLWHRMLESLHNNWQEAEAQHEHAD